MGYGFGNRIAVGRRAITAQAQAGQVVWKVAVYGAGTPTSNGEYVWDGETYVFGRPRYFYGTKYIEWNEVDWIIFDTDFDGGTVTYISSDLATWTVFDGASPAPFSALSYAQDSEIQSITLSGAGTSTSNGEYVWDGTTLINGKPKYESGINYIYWYTDAIFPEIQFWSLFDDYDGQDNYSSDDLITWTESNGQSPAPSVLALVYTA